VEQRTGKKEKEAKRKNKGVRVCPLE